LLVAGGSGGVDIGGTMGLNMVPHHPNFEHWLRESPAASLLGALTGSATMRYWQDAVFIKRAGSQDDGTPWHNDYCTWPFKGEQLPILWIALTDVGADDAPLVTLRGSHLDPWRYYSPMSPPGLAVTDEYHAWEELLAKPQSPNAVLDRWIVSAGDALVMHPKLIHSSESTPPHSGGRRVSFSTRWLGDDAIWAPDPYTFRIEVLLADARMRHGEPPPTSLFPIVWAACAYD
jgi:ectoine hydroxylase-related dioxygenase (phytanoyl-CoA dioxygenase family)